MPSQAARRPARPRSSRKTAKRRPIRRSTSRTTYCPAAGAGVLGAAWAGCGLRAWGAARLGRGWAGWARRRRPARPARLGLGLCSGTRVRLGRAAPGATGGARDLAGRDALGRAAGVARGCRRSGSAPRRARGTPGRACAATRWIRSLEPSRASSARRRAFSRLTAAARSAVRAISRFIRSRSTLKKTMPASSTKIRPIQIRPCSSGRARRRRARARPAQRAGHRRGAARRAGGARTGARRAGARRAGMAAIRPPPPVDPAGGAQACRTRARVVGHLAGRGRHRAAGEQLGLGRPPAARRPGGRAGRCSRARGRPGSA